MMLHTCRDDWYCHWLDWTGDREIVAVAARLGGSWRRAWLHPRVDLEHKAALGISA